MRPESLLRKFNNWLNSSLMKSVGTSGVGVLMTKMREVGLISPAVKKLVEEAAEAKFKNFFPPSAAG